MKKATPKNNQTTDLLLLNERVELPGYLCDPPPLVWCGTGAPQLLGQQVGGRGLHQLSQHLLHDAEGPVPAGHVQAQAHCLQRRADVAVVELTRSGYCWSSRRLLLRVLSL